MGYYFNIPSMNQLTYSQRLALNSTTPIALSGGPGTGKSIVSLYRHINLWTRGNRSLLLTYTTTLKLYLEKCCELTNNDAAMNIDTTYSRAYKPQHKSHFHEIIIDEAQDVSLEIYDMLHGQSDYISFGADNSQSLYSEQGCSYCELHEYIENSINEGIGLNECFLDSNFRNTKSIMQFAREAFPYANISQREINNCKRPEGNPPLLFVTNESKYASNDPSQDNEIINILNEYVESGHNIAILCPWAKNVDYFYNLISNEFNDVTFYYRKGNCDYGLKEIGSIHITTFKSAKGLEFDTVIIPNFHRAFKRFDPKFHIDWKDYYVGVTRAKTNLFLISCENIQEISSVVEVEYI